MFRQLRAAGRAYRVLGIESSCDDTALCLIRREPHGPPVLEDHIKVTLDSAKDGGIIPVDAMAHHLAQLGPQVNLLLRRNDRPRVDLVAAAQGPGMYSSLAAGLQVAKGLAVAWDVPLIPVHHMLGHMLTPRFWGGPTFPFLSLLVSGGHTMFVLSESVFRHTILANTIDIAIGNALDKCARHLGMHGTMLGRELDIFCSTPITPSSSSVGDLNIPLPLEKHHDGSSKRAALSFAHFASLLPRLERQHGWHPLSSQSPALRRDVGIQIQDAMSNHLVRKMSLALPLSARNLPLVVAGGVAANSRLRRHLRAFADDHGLTLHFAELEWCTDNALMIGWAAIELAEAGISSDLSATPRAKWPLEDLAALQPLH